MKLQRKHHKNQDTAKSKFQDRASENLLVDNFFNLDYNEHGAECFGKEEPLQATKSVPLAKSGRLSCSSRHDMIRESYKQGVSPLL